MACNFVMPTPPGRPIPKLFRKTSSQIVTYGPDGNVKDVVNVAFKGPTLTKFEKGDVNEYLEKKNKEKEAASKAVQMEIKEKAPAINQKELEKAQKILEKEQKALEKEAVRALKEKAKEEAALAKELEKQREKEQKELEKQLKEAEKKRQKESKAVTKKNVTKKTIKGGNRKTRRRR
jgi:hypothetical protein